MILELSGARHFNNPPGLFIGQLPPLLFGASVIELRFIAETMYNQFLHLIPAQHRPHSLQEWYDVFAISKGTMEHTSGKVKKT